jgi:hypothetical protein
MAFSNPLCQQMYDTILPGVENVNKAVEGVLSKMYAIQSKLQIYTNGLDLNSLLDKFSVPELRVFTMAEYLDLILNCGIFSCGIGGALDAIQWVNQYVLNNGPLDPANIPDPVVDYLQPFLDLANAQMQLQQSLAAQAMCVTMNKSPLGKIGRLKEMFDNFIAMSGVLELVNATQSTIDCLINSYPDAANDETITRFFTLTEQLNYDNEGNIQVLKPEDQIIMNDYTQLKTDLSGIALGQ